jgi:hypothetical protein
MKFINQKKVEVGFGNNCYGQSLINDHDLTPQFIEVGNASELVARQAVHYGCFRNLSLNGA